MSQDKGALCNRNPFFALLTMAMAGPEVIWSLKVLVNNV